MNNYLKDMGIDKRKKDSIETQIKNALQKIQFQTSYTFGDPLPSPEEISSFYDINLDELKIIFDTLLKNQLIIEKNSHYYLKHILFDSIFFTSTISTVDTVKQKGMKPSLKLITTKKVEDVLITLKSKNLKMANALYAQRVYYANDIPISFYENYLNLDIIDTHVLDLSKPFYIQLKERLGLELKKSIRYIQAKTLNSLQSKYLSEASGSPCFVVFAETYDQFDRLIEILISYSTSSFQISYDT